MLQHFIDSNSPLQESTLEIPANSPETLSSTASSLNAFPETQIFRINYFHDRQLLRFGRHFEQVCFERESREDFAKRAIQSLRIWAKIGRVIFIGRE